MSSFPTGQTQARSMSTALPPSHSHQSVHMTFRRTLQTNHFSALCLPVSHKYPASRENNFKPYFRVCPWNTSSAIFPHKMSALFSVSNRVICPLVVISSFGNITTALGPHPRNSRLVPGFLFSESLLPALVRRTKRGNKLQASEVWAAYCIQKCATPIPWNVWIETETGIHRKQPVKNRLPSTEKLPQMLLFPAQWGLEWGLAPYCCGRSTPEVSHIAGLSQRLKTTLLLPVPTKTCPFTVKRRN